MYTAYPNNKFHRDPMSIFENCLSPLQTRHPHIRLGFGLSAKKLLGRQTADARHTTDVTAAVHHTCTGRGTGTVIEKNPESRSDFQLSQP